MNEHDREFQPPAELPQPQIENHSASGENSGLEAVSERERSKAIEQAASNSTLAAQSPIAVPSMASPAGAQTGQTPGNQPVPADTTALIADDIDLIEKEWVNKAKAIVEKTKTDPHAQNKEMNKVKADYIKKRYNKELKLAED